LAAQAAQAEAAALRRAPITTSADEAWVNVLGPGAWNVLHTHPGTTYSAVLFVTDGACCDGEWRPAGRLAFVPSGPHTLSTEQQVLSLVPVAGAGASARAVPGRAAPATTTSPHPCACASQAHVAAREGPPSTPVRYLLIDPTPCTCVVFPSFIPHFVLPTPAAASPHDTRRLSLAFNFGFCDPVLAHVHVLPGVKRVKLFLEPTSVYGLKFREEEES